MIYDELKIELIFMVINGCKFAEWHMFNNWCQSKLSKSEYSNIRKMTEYKTLFNHFKEV